MPSSATGSSKVQDQRVGAAIQALLLLLRAVARHEQERAHGSDRDRGGGLALAHEGLAAALGDQRAVLLIGLVGELDDAGIRARARLALGDDLGGAIDGVALEERGGEKHVGHAEIADGGADRGVVDGCKQQLQQNGANGFSCQTKRLF